MIRNVLTGLLFAGATSLFGMEAGENPDLTEQKWLEINQSIASGDNISEVLNWTGRMSQFEQDSSASSDLQWASYLEQIKEFNIQDVWQLIRCAIEKRRFHQAITWLKWRMSYSPEGVLNETIPQSVITETKSLLDKNLIIQVFQLSGLLESVINQDAQFSTITEEGVKTVKQSLEEDKDLENVLHWTRLMMLGEFTGEADRIAQWERNWQSCLGELRKLDKKHVWNFIGYAIDKSYFQEAITWFVWCIFSEVCNADIQTWELPKEIIEKLEALLKEGDEKALAQLIVLIPEIMHDLRNAINTLISIKLNASQCDTSNTNQNYFDPTGSELLEDEYFSSNGSSMVELGKEEQEDAFIFEAEFSEKNLIDDELINQALECANMELIRDLIPRMDENHLRYLELLSVITSENHLLDESKADEEKKPQLSWLGGWVKSLTEALEDGA